jgi:hypothetical protein
MLSWEMKVWALGLTKWKASLRLLLPKRTRTVLDETLDEIIEILIVRLFPLARNCHFQQYPHSLHSSATSLLIS